MHTSVQTLTSLITLNELVYPVYAKLTLTRALDNPYPLAGVVPENAFRKFSLGSVTLVWPPRTTKPVIAILQLMSTIRQRYREEDADNTSVVIFMKPTALDILSEILVLNVTTEDVLVRT